MISCPSPVITSIFYLVVKPIAGRDVEIGAATETDSHYQLEEKKKSGIGVGSGGCGISVSASVNAVKAAKKATG
ncbi:hypothetical protein ID11_16805 [Pantoea vagans]|nr:hypothetical protein ID11_16805 [Pantoea vagans]